MTDLGNNKTTLIRIGPPAENSQILNHQIRLSLPASLPLRINQLGHLYISSPGILSQTMVTPSPANSGSLAPGRTYSQPNHTAFRSTPVHIVSSNSLTPNIVANASRNNLIATSAAPYVGSQERARQNSMTPTALGPASISQEVRSRAPQTPPIPQSMINVVNTPPLPRNPPLSLNFHPTPRGPHTPPKSVTTPSTPRTAAAKIVSAPTTARHANVYPANLNNRSLNPSSPSQMPSQQAQHLPPSATKPPHYTTASSTPRRPSDCHKSATSTRSDVLPANKVTTASASKGSVTNASISSNRSFKDDKSSATLMKPHMSSPSKLVPTKTSTIVTTPMLAPQIVVNSQPLINNSSQYNSTQERETPKDHNRVGTSLRTKNRPKRNSKTSNTVAPPSNGVQTKILSQDQPVITQNSGSTSITNPKQEVVNQKQQNQMVVIDLSSDEEYTHNSVDKEKKDLEKPTSFIENREKASLPQTASFLENAVSGGSPKITPRQNTEQAKSPSVASQDRALPSQLSSPNKKLPENVMEGTKKTLPAPAPSPSQPKHQKDRGVNQLAVGGGTTKQQSNKVYMPPTHFSWKRYLELKPAVVAPKEAFMQALEPPENIFQIGMKLEALDPHTNHWGLATVIRLEGPRLRIRFDGGDTMNDVYQLVDSNDIRAVNSRPDENLFPPRNYSKNISGYTREVEKIITKPGTVIAPAECFKPVPHRPRQNLFEVGMKLEALDRKNPQLICPATIMEVRGDDIKISFDGWSSAFSYTCQYYSRDIFPVNWCHDANHSISAPNGWDQLINPTDDASKRNKSPLINGPSRSSSASKDSPQPRQFARKKGKSHKAGQSIKTNTPVKSGSSTRLTRSIDMQPKLSRKSNNSKTEEKKDMKKSPTKQSNNASCESNGGTQLKISCADFSGTDTEDEEGSDYEGPVTNKFQCQRTVSFADWKQSQSNGSFQTEDQESTESLSDNKNSTSIAASLSVPTPSASDTSDLSTIAPPVKKVKIDASHTPNNTSSLPKVLRDFSVEDVVRLLKSGDESLEKLSKLFVEQEIDGKALSLMTQDNMYKMGIKMGPALKLWDIIEKLKRQG